MWNQSKFNNKKNITDVGFGSLLLILNEFQCLLQLFLLKLSLNLVIVPTPDVTFSFKNHV